MVPDTSLFISVIKKILKKIFSEELLKYNMFLFLPFVQSDSYHLHFFYLTFLYQPMYTGQPKPDMCSHFGRAFFLFNQDLMQTSNRSRS